MRRWIMSIVAAVAALAGLVAVSPGASAAARPSQDDSIIPGHYIVTLRDGASPDDVARDHGRRYGAQVEHVYRSAIRGYAAAMSEASARRVATESTVASVQPDRVMSIEARPTKPGGGGGGQVSQTLPTGINRIDGDVSSTKSGDGSGDVNVDVAVIDTGIDVTHPDLNVVGGVNCSSGTSYADGNGHGTHVSGTIAAKDNGFGVVGVAPGARLWAVRVLNNQGSGSWSSVICGIDWVTQHADTIGVANMSLGGTGSDSACSAADALHNAICASVSAGVTYAVAAGNETDDAKNHVPAAYDEVITVSALADFNGAAGGGGAATCRSDVDDTFASFSNYGADVDIIAPGVCIYSTWKGGGYNTISGTSMATPHVAGAAALYKSAHPEATPVQVKEALTGAGNPDWDNSDDHDSIKEPLLGVGGF